MANGPFAVGSKKSLRIDGDHFDDGLSRDFRRFFLVAAEEPTPKGLKSFSWSFSRSCFPVRKSLSA